MAESERETEANKAAAAKTRQHGNLPMSTDEPIDVLDLGGQEPKRQSRRVRAENDKVPKQS